MYLKCVSLSDLSWHPNSSPWLLDAENRWSDSWPWKVVGLIMNRRWKKTQHNIGIHIAISSYSRISWKSWIYSWWYGNILEYTLLLANFCFPPKVTRLLSAASDQLLPLTLPWRPPGKSAGFGLHIFCIWTMEVSPNGWYHNCWMVANGILLS